MRFYQVNRSQRLVSSTAISVVLVAILHSLAWAQAGSSAPVVINTIEGFYGGVTSLDPENNESSAQVPMLPRGILKLTSTEKYILWVELESGRLNLLEQQDDGGLLTRKTFPISIGSSGYGKEVEGDKKTPLGVYHFTSFLTDEMLVAYYGIGAYPINYPNAIDLRRNRTGSGIWLHGLPKNVDERPFLDSDGCIVIDNVSLEEMASYIDTGVTHIVLTKEDIQWQQASQVESTREALEEAFVAWREAWESMENNTYLAFYADDFNDFNRDKTEWDAYSRSPVNF